MQSTKKWFYLDKKHQQMGNYSDDELFKLYSTKVIQDNNYVWKDGFEDWVKLHKVLPTLQSEVLNKTVGREDKLPDINKQNFEYGDAYEHLIPQVSQAELHQEKYSKPYDVAWVSAPCRENNIDLVHRLIHILKEQKQLEGLRVFPNRVDGQIIGTGEADFTKDNVSYHFDYKDKTFQLIDVPGIEGDESKYEHLVHKAIAKAHLVFYISATDKKPEKNTAQKIKSYLNDYAKIYPILNIHGGLSVYYANEDSDEPHESLEDAHKEIGKIFNETFSVLRENVGEHLIQGGQYMQGLMAFYALAYNQEKKETTIFYGRNHDLGRDQKKFLKLFNHDIQKMTDFSQINKLQEFIISKFDTFKHDIVESNKLKIVRRIDETVEVLQAELDRHQTLQSKVKHELDLGLSVINELTDDFERSLKMEFEHISNNFFSEIADNADGIIAQNDWGMSAELGSLGWGKEKETKQNNINNGIANIIENNKDDYKNKLEKAVNKKYNEWHENIEKELKRMSKNVGTVINTLKINDMSESKLNISFDSSFDVKKMMGNLMSIGAMVATGISIGTVFPGIGHVVGGVTAAVLGLLKAFWESVGGKEKRIAARQNTFRESLKSEQRLLVSKLNAEAKSITDTLREKVREEIAPVINAEYRKMLDVERILGTGIQDISNLKQSIQEKDYGTV